MIQSNSLDMFNESRNQRKAWRVLVSENSLCLVCIHDVRERFHRELCKRGLW